MDPGEKIEHWIVHFASDVGVEYILLPIFQILAEQADKPRDEIDQLKNLGVTQQSTEFSLPQHKVMSFRGAVEHKGSQDPGIQYITFLRDIEGFWRTTIQNREKTRKYVPRFRDRASRLLNKKVATRTATESRSKSRVTKTQTDRQSESWLKGAQTLRRAPPIESQNHRTTG